MSGLSVRLLIRRVDLLTMRLFLSAIEERQIGRAAILEKMVPSAATKRIHDLEELAGLKLLDRNSQGVVPTQAGEVMAKRLREVFAALENMRRELSDFTEGVRGLVRLAVTPAILIRELAGEIGDFTRAFPYIDVEIQEDINPAVLRAVKSGDVDLAVLVAAAGLDLEGLDIIPYRTDRLVVVYLRDHAFSQKADISLNDLLEERLIGIKPTTSLMTEMREAARKLGRELVPKYTVDSVEAARSLVKAGLGVTIQPECLLSIEDFDRLAIGSITESWAHRSLVIATQKSKPLSSAARMLIGQLTGEPQR